MPYHEEKTQIAAPLELPQVPKEASLIQIYGPNLGARMVIDAAVVTIGRDSGNQIVIDSDSVSRNHAELCTSDGGVYLVDQGSTNGSLVNELEVSECLLQNGDLLKFGSVIFKFVTGGNAEALYHEEIYRMAITDGLTGVANRRCFEEFLERELARAVRYSRPLSLALIDADHFKQVNDVYGHLAGDSVLRQLAQLAQASMRRDELLARYGGEEFAIVLPDTDPKGARVVGLRETVEAISELNQKITMIFGAATITVDSDGPFMADETRENLIKQADDALYYSKGNRRNRVTHFNDMGK